MCTLLHTTDTVSVSEVPNLTTPEQFHWAILMELIWILTLVIIIIITTILKDTPIAHHTTDNLKDRFEKSF
jgi:hypothetical protein